MKRYSIRGYDWLKYWLPLMRVVHALNEHEREDGGEDEKMHELEKGSH